MAFNHYYGKNRSRKSSEDVYGPNGGNNKTTKRIVKKHRDQFDDSVGSSRTYRKFYKR